MGDNSFASINYQDPMSKQIFKNHIDQMCVSYKIKGESDFVVDIKVDSKENTNQFIISGKVSISMSKLFVKYSACNPPNYNSNFSGSGLPYPNEEIAFDGTENKGVVPVINGTFTIKIKYPNSYYDNMGTIYVPPQIKLILVNDKNKQLGEIMVVKLGNGIPFRTLTWPTQRIWSKGPEFYNVKLPVRTQYQILLDSAYPSTNVMPKDFWGLKPPY